MFSFLISANLPAADQPVAPAPTLKRDRVAELVEKLNASIDDPVQPNGMTVEEYLAKLAKVHGVEIVLDEDIFKAEGVPAPADTKLRFQAPKGIRLHALLRSVASSIKDNAAEPEDNPELDHRAALIRNGRIVVTNGYTVQRQQNVPNEDLDADWTLKTTVWVIANDEPLSAVLRRVAEVHDVNVVVTAGAAKMAETRITSRILNAPLGTTILSLADQCGLAVFVRHNVILVTTPEHAKKLKQDQDWLEARRELESKTWAADRLALEPFGKTAAIGGRIKLVAPAVDEKVAVEANKLPLRQVISSLTKSGFNITLDPATGIKADAEVTLKLNNVSCEAAVKQLAELAGLRVVRMDNSLFITTPEKADRLTPAPPAAKPKSKKSKTP